MTLGLGIRTEVLRALGCVLLLCCGLWGCAKPYEDPNPKLAPGMEDTTDESLLDATEKLASQNVKIISMGDSYMISIPASSLFYKASPKMKWSSYDLLDDVVAYLQSYRKLIVKVTVYSENCQSEARTRALTETRAKVLGKYLWSQNIGTGMILTEGAGNDHPITGPQKACSDNSPNSRAEIVYRQVVA